MIFLTRRPTKCRDPGQVSNRDVKSLDAITPHVIEVPTLYRIGAVATDGPGRTHSLEGHLLSVSACPDAWMQIARIGSDTVHAIQASGATPLRLVNMHACLDDTEVMEGIERWGRQQDLLEDALVWRAWFQDEDSMWRFMEFESREDAEDQLELEPEEILTSGPDGQPAIEPTAIIKASPKALSQTGALAMANSGLELTLILAAEQSDNTLHGVYWDEAYDPMSLSAPRAGLFRDRIADMEVTTRRTWPSDATGLSTVATATQAPQRYGTMPRIS